MPSIFTKRMADALKGNAPRVILAAIDHPSGMFRCWSGIGLLDYDGHEWTGLGLLGTIAPVKMTTELAIQEIAFALSGVDTDTLALLDDKVRGYEADVWLACLDERGKVIADPWNMLFCELDYQKFQVDESGMATIVIIGRAGFYTLERPIDEVWTPENQKRLYSGDTGLDMQPKLENQQIDWTLT